MMRTGLAGHCAKAENATSQRIPVAANRRSILRMALPPLQLFASPSLSNTGNSLLRGQHTSATERTKLTGATTDGGQRRRGASGLSERLGGSRRLMCRAAQLMREIDGQQEQDWRRSETRRVAALAQRPQRMNNTIDDFDRDPEPRQRHCNRPPAPHWPEETP